MARVAGVADIARLETRQGPVVLRRLRWWELPYVYQLEEQVFPSDAWSPGMFWSELAEVDTRYYLAAHHLSGESGDNGAEAAVSGEIVGYAGLMVVADTADVQTIAVSEAFRRAGLGRALMSELLAEAADRGCREVLLEVRVDNEPAQRLYRDLGFVGIGVRRGYYQPEGVDALVMRSRAVSAFRRDAAHRKERIAGV